MDTHKNAPLTPKGREAMTSRTATAAYGNNSDLAARMPDVRFRG
jgi:hypothetical protein